MIKYRPNRMKIGKVFHNNREFPVWIDNSLAQEIVSLNIFDDGQLNEDALDELGFKKKFIPCSPETFSHYYFVEIKQIREKLKELHNHFKVEIDYNKLDKFLFKIEKVMVVRRLEGQILWELTD